MAKGDPGRIALWKVLIRTSFSLHAWMETGLHRRVSVHGLPRPPHSKLMSLSYITESRDRLARLSDNANPKIHAALADRNRCIV